MVLGGLTNGRADISAGEGGGGSLTSGIKKGSKKAYETNIQQYKKMFYVLGKIHTAWPIAGGLSQY